MYALHRTTTNSRIIFYRQHYYLPEENHVNMCCQYPLPELPSLYCDEVIPDEELEDDFMDVDDILPELTDEDLEMIQPQTRPLWLDRTNFNYQDFYFNVVPQQFADRIVHVLTNERNMKSTTLLRFNTQQECDNFMNYVLEYFSGFGVWPEISFTALDSIVAIYIEWLGGYVCEHIQDDNGFTFEVFLFFHNN